jgi:hypothetical protein
MQRPYIAPRHTFSYPNNYKSFTIQYFFSSMERFNQLPIIRFFPANTLVVHLPIPIKIIDDTA